ncbi:MAG: N-acetyltransferase [Candidatus Izimaplasma sp.]|nr:N-acetyltransferase [Candidatus Izimaplasma bacterium]
MIIRQATPNDNTRIEWLTREAFWNHMNVACDEHYIIHKTRKLPCFNKNLAFIAEEEGKLVGYIALYDAELKHHNETHKILTICPIVVHPFYQQKGIGTMLIKKAHKEAKEMGYGAVVIFGDPDYYKRFGYVNAKHHGITTVQGDNFDEFLSKELVRGFLKGKDGMFKELHKIPLSKDEIVKYDNQLLSNIFFKKDQKETK